MSNPLCQNVTQERFNMTMTNATDNQLELGFNGIQPRPNAARREGRIARAGWWFSQMRDIVERAMDWETAGKPRPEQIWIPGANREVKV
jgi:hypothetical protein